MPPLSQKLLYPNSASLMGALGTIITLEATITPPVATSKEHMNEHTTRQVLTKSVLTNYYCIIKSSYTLLYRLEDIILIVVEKEPSIKELFHSIMCWEDQLHRFTSLEVPCFISLTFTNHTKGWSLVKKKSILL